MHCKHIFKSTAEHWVQLDPASHAEHTPFNNDHPCGQPMQVFVELQLKSALHTFVSDREYPAKHYSQSRGF